MSAHWWLVALHFTAASASSVLLAAILLAGLRRAAARWPALLAHRSPWLGAQAAIALVFALAFIPRGEIAPTVKLAVPAIADAAPVTNERSPSPVQNTIQQTPDADPTELLLQWLPLAWLAVYLTGLTWHAARRLQSTLRWRVLMRQTRVLDGAELRASPVMTPGQRAYIAASMLTVRTTDLPVSPMLHGVLRPGLLLPTHMAALDSGQQRMIVEHELTHCRRADPLWLALSGFAGLLFWFNRPYRQLGEALREAVELGCDDAVLAGRSASERQGYAAALVAQLRLQAQGITPAGAAFGSLGVSGRVQRMRVAQPARLSWRGRLLAGATLGGLAFSGAALQPAFSSPAATVPAPSLSAPVGTTEAAPVVWRYPLAQARITSLYGVRSPSRPKGHKGIDFAARRGTQVVAVAAGSVSQTGFDAAWGHYVRVDHGGGRSSLLIHLDRIDVAAGRQVAAGDPLGTSGASGKVTGPHLHLEYWQDGQRRDPALVLPDLLAHATAKSIAQRAAQGNPIPIDR